MPPSDENESLADRPKLGVGLRHGSARSRLSACQLLSPRHAGRQPGGRWHRTDDRRARSRPQDFRPRSIRHPDRPRWAHGDMAGETALLARAREASDPANGSWISTSRCSASVSGISCWPTHSAARSRPRRKARLASPTSGLRLPARRIPVFAGFGAGKRAINWHGSEVKKLPPRAKLLASTEGCPITGVLGRIGGLRAAVSRRGDDRARQGMGGNSGRRVSRDATSRAGRRASC